MKPKIDDQPIAYAVRGNGFFELCRYRDVAEGQQQHVPGTEVVPLYAAPAAEPPRCPRCGYTHEDCLYHMDHRLCGEPDPPAAEPVAQQPPLCDAQALAEIKAMYADLRQLQDGFMNSDPQWTEWDESVRQRLIAWGMRYLSPAAAEPVAQQPSTLPQSNDERIAKLLREAGVNPNTGRNIKGRS